jgi:hypothetical protein
MSHRAKEEREMKGVLYIAQIGAEGLAATMLQSHKEEKI